MRQQAGELRSDLLRLLKRVADAFQRSKIRRSAAESGDEWAYSLITGACLPGAPLIIGFNWGASSNARYEPQSEVNATPWREGENGSLIPILPYVSRFFPNLNLDKLSQTNYCFFRSKAEADISSEDLELCRPIFDDLLRVMRPTLVLSFSARLRDHVRKTDQVTCFRNQRIKNLNMTYAVATGKLWGGIPVSFLPHPNYPMEGDAREKAWKFCSPCSG